MNLNNVTANICYFRIVFGCQKFVLLGCKTYEHIIFSLISRVAFHILVTISLTAIMSANTYIHIINKEGARSGGFRCVRSVLKSKIGI